METGKKGGLGVFFWMAGCALTIKGITLSWEAVAGLSSAVIALCALGLTLWQGWITRQHNRLSVRPHLTTWSQSDKGNHIYAVHLLNNGIGPALIKSFQILVDGQVMIGEGVEPIEKALKILFPQYQYASNQSYLSNGYMMPAKEARDLVVVRFLGDKVPKPEEVEHAWKRGKLVIKYESVYEEKWTFDTSERLEGLG